MSYIPFINHPYKKYHSAFLNDYLESIKHLDLSQEFNSLNLSQVSFHILYNCEFSSWSEKLREEVQRVKQIYMVNSIFAQILHPVERRYVDRDKYHFERNFNNDEFVEISEDSLSFEEDKIYQITPKKFTRVYNNVYYDNHTNEEDYYEDKDDSDLGSDSEEYYPIDKREINIIDYTPFEDLNRYFYIEEINHIQYRLDRLHTCPYFEQNKEFNDRNRFISKTILSGKDIEETIQIIKNSITYGRRFKIFKLYLTEDDIRPFYHFIDLDDEILYKNLDYFKVGIFVNKDHPDPLRRKKVRDFAYLYFGFEMYKFNYDYTYNTFHDFLNADSRCNNKRHERNFNHEIVKIYGSIYDKYKLLTKYSNQLLSFLNYSITIDHPVCKIDPEFFKPSSLLHTSLSHMFNEYSTKIENTDYLPYITIKVPYPKITQEEMTLLDKYPMQAAFIYKNYPYLQNPLVSNKNYNPFFNMLRILEKTNCKLNISKI